VAIIRPKTETNNGYLKYIVGSQLFKDPIDYEKEQLQINEYIQSESRKHASLIAKIQTATGLLKEYRPTLISEVVTGKIDVRDEVIP